MVLASPRGERRLPAADFWMGPGKTALEADEYLQAIQFPLPPEGSAGQYLKLGRSKMGDLAVVGVGVLGFPDPEAPAGFRFRIGLNSTAPTPYRVPSVEEYLAGNPLSEEVNVLNARSDKPTRGQALPDQAGGARPNDGQITAHAMHGGT